MRCRSITVVLALAALAGCSSSPSEIPVDAGITPVTDTGSKDDAGSLDDAGADDVPSIADARADVAPGSDATSDATAPVDTGSPMDAPSATDASLDAPVMDAPAVDAPVDAPVADVPPADVNVTCRRDPDCASAPGHLFCDVIAGRCVECNPTSDSCAPGTYCDTTHRCILGCRNGSDCVGADAGMTCDPVRHLCVGCLTDANCAAGTLCTAGACVPGCSATHACPTGNTCCAGLCVNTSADATTCGSCTHACSTVHAMPACVAGACVEHCAEGWGDCDTSRDNGCETSTTDNPSNCGACGVSCALAHASATCATDHCAIVSCIAGYTDCDHNAMTGCEAALNTDLMNCGACGNVCATGQSCTAGTCACPAGQILCRGACTPVLSDPLNCGMCNLACPAGALCTSGVCSTDIVTYNTTTPLPASEVFVDVCTTPGATHYLASVDDGLTGVLTIPFGFRFFETVYTQVNVSTNGWIGFGAGSFSAYAYGPYNLPNVVAPRPAFFAMSANLVASAAGECFTTLGTAPTRQFVWEASGQLFYSPRMGSLTWEVFLNEGTNTVDVIYQNVTGTDGATVSVGMQNATSTRSFMYEYLRASSVTSGLRLRFTPS